MFDVVTRAVGTRAGSSTRKVTGLIGRVIQKRRAALAIASAAALLCSADGLYAGTELDVVNGQTDLTAASTYGGTAPTTTSDVTFLNVTYSPTAFTVPSSLAIGTLNSLNTTQTLSISNGTAAADTLTLSGGSNSVASANGGTTGDLLFVATGGTLNISNGTNPLGVVLGAAGNLNVSGTSTIGSIVSGSNGFTKTGAGTLTLSGVNTFAGAVALNAGTVSIAADSGLGAAANGVTFNGGTLTVSAAVTPTRTFTVGAAGGVINLTGGAGTVGKLNFGTINQLTGSGPLTKFGAADLQLAVAQNYSGIFTISGLVEASNSGSLGTSSVILTKSGELSVSTNANLANAITVNSTYTGSDPILSPIGGGSANVSGTLTLNGPLTVALRDFNTTTNVRNMTFSGVVSGNGAITVAQGTATSGSATLFINNAGNTGYSGNITANAGTGVSFGTATSSGSGTITINSTTAGLGAFGVGYDFGATVPAFTNARTGTTTGGVFAVNTTLPASTTINLATLGGGGMLLGAQGTGVYQAATLTPDGTTFRLGGGGGTLTISNAVLTGANNLVVGDSRMNGGGTIILAANNTYTGTTAVNGGTLQVGTGGTVGSIGSNTGTITVNGTLAFNRSDNITVTNVLSGTGRIQQSAASTLTLAAANSLGGLTVNNGTINIGSSDLPLTSGTLINGNNGTITSSGGRIVLNVSGGDIGASNGNTITLNAIIANGTGSSIDFFNSSATGTTVVTGANTYTGVTNIQQQNITVSSLNSVATNATLGTVKAASSNLGAPSSIANGTLSFSSTNASKLAYVGGGETTDRVINLAGANTTTIGNNTVTIDQSGTGLLKFVGNGNSPSVAVTSTGAARKTLVLTGSTLGTGEISGVIGENSATNRTLISKQGSGAWTLSGTNTFTGELQVAAGTLTVTSVSNYGVASAIGARAATQEADGVEGTNIIGIHFGSGTSTGGTLRYAGSTAQSTNRQIRMAAVTTNTIDASGTDPSATLGFTYSSANTNLFDSAGNRTLNLIGTNTGNNTFNIRLTDQAASTGLTSLVKSGTGTWILGGASTHTGTTIVNGGLLRVNGSTTGSATTVNAGGALGGTGSISAAVTVAAGGANVDLRDGIIGTLSLGSTLTLAGAVATPNSLYFDLGVGAAGTDKIATTGATNVTNSGGAVIYLNQLAGGAINPSTYTLIQGGAAGSPVGSYVLGTTRAGGNTYSLTSSGNNIQVVVSTATAGPAAAFFSGAADANWTNAGNWNTDATSATPAGAVPGVGTNVTFYTTNPAATNLATSLNGSDFEITSLTFSSASTSAVSIGGTGTLTIDADGANGNIAGNGITQSAEGATHLITSKVGLGSSQTWTVGPATGTSTAGLRVNGAIGDFGAGSTLTKAGTGTLTLTGVNTYSGGTVINAGTLAAGAANAAAVSALGSGAVSVASAGALTLNGTGGTATVTYPNLISGSGTLNVATGTGTTGTTVLNGNLSGVTGTVNITGNTKAQFNAVGGPPATSASVNVGSNATLYAVGGINLQNSLTLNGGDTGESLGQLRLEGGSNQIGNVTLAGNITGSGDAFFGSNTSQSGTVSGVVGESGGARELSKSGAGTIILANANTYTGGTRLAGGILSINGDSSLGGTSGSVTFSGASTLQFRNAISMPSTRNLVLNANGTIDTSLAAAGSVSNIAGTISGSGALIKSYATQGNATNPLVLSGNNTFTGNVTITSGWLTITNSGALGVGTKTIGATTNQSSDSLHLDPGAGPSIVLPATMSFSTSNDTFTNANEGTIVNENGTNTLNGPVTLTSGGGGSIFASRSGTITFAGDIAPNVTGRLLRLRGDGNGVISGKITNGNNFGDLPLNRDLGAGTWTLSGANAYTGATTVGAGTLKLGNTTALGGTGLTANTTDNGTNVSSGATVDLGGTTNVNEVIRLNGTGVGGAGALVNTGPSAASIGAVGGGAAIAGITGTSTGLSTPPAINITGGGGSGATATSSLGVSAGSFTINGGTTVYSVAPTVTIAGNSGLVATATANLTSGVVTSITINNAGNGFATAPTIAFSGGTVTTTGTNPSGSGNATNFVLSGINITNPGSGFTSAPTVTAGASTLTASLSGIVLQTSSSIGGTGDIVVNGIISETGGSRALTKVGTNSLYLANANTYTGGTTITGGTILATNAAGSATGTAAVTVSGGAVGSATASVVGGSGTIAGPVNVTAGGVSPGDASSAATLTGRLKVGSLSVTGGSASLVVDAGGTNAVTEYDQVQATGTAGVNVGGATLRVNTFNGFGDGSTPLYVVANDSPDPVAGTFSSVVLDGLALTETGVGTGIFTDGASNSVSIVYSANYDALGTASSAIPGSGNDIAITVAVPEPGVISVAVLSAAGLLVRRRRRA